MDFSEMRAFFDAGSTLNIDQRIVWLRALQTRIQKHEQKILAALQQDLGKVPFEGYMTEIGMVLDELRFQIRHLKAWARPRRVRTPLAQFHARSYIHSEPYGLVLIMAPWNYPFQLSIEPLIGAIAAGNCVVLKPSNYAPHTAQAMQIMLEDCLPGNLVRVIQGGRAENTALLDTRFDYIFFTGGKTVGRLVMEKAAQFLTPVSLELGGKSPVIVLNDARIDLAAKRIVFGKLLNAGQTCVAPDYVLVQPDAKDALLASMKKYIRLFLGADPLSNPDYPQIITQKHIQRLSGLMENAVILHGGKRNGMRIEPTLIQCSGREDAAMQEEIFGPILPILEMDSLDDMIAFIREDEKPLALYLFTENKDLQREVVRRVSFGGGCINDTIVHLATSHMGFGGVGASGMGAYHGIRSFQTFSHEKSILNKSTWMDLPIRYHPYQATKEKLIRFFLK